MTEKPRIGVLRPYPEPVLAALRGRGELVGEALAAPVTGAAAVEILAQCDAALITTLDRIDAETLAACPRLRVLSSIGIGTDRFDLNAIAAAGIRLATTPDAVTEATADHAVAMMLALARRVAEGDAALRAGGWPEALPLGTDVHGKTLGLIGMGRIGQAIARRAAGFGMAVRYHQRRPLDGQTATTLGATYMELDGLLAQADFLVVQVPLTEATRHLIGAPELAQMKPTAMLINTARGGIVDDAALATALKAGHLAGAALDVFEGEPEISLELRAAPNLLMTPHIGSATTETRSRMVQEAVVNLLRLMSEVELKETVS